MTTGTAGTNTRSREWQPDTTAMLAMSVAGTVAFVAGLFGYLGIWSAATGQSEFELGGRQALVGLLVTLALTFVLMAIHEAVHGIMVSRYGGRPTYGAAMAGRAFPVFYCTAEGSWFTRGQFAAIALAPFLVLTPMMGILVAVLPVGGWLVVPAALLFAGCVGDLWMSVIIARLPPGTMVEDLKSGMRFHPRVDASVNEI